MKTTKLRILLHSAWYSLVAILLIFGSVAKLNL